MKDTKINVLDHGYVRLIDSMGSDLAVSRAARVSYDAEWRAGKDEGSDAKLIRSLANAGHSTPFEAVEFQFEAYLPVFVCRQWHRHRTWTYNELSGRYKELPEVFYVPELDQITTQHPSNKQMRTDERNPKAEFIQRMMREQNELAFEAYRELLASGTPRELARSVLPLSTYTHMFAKTNLMNFIKFCKLRDHSHAQYEIQVYARAMTELARPITPVSIAAWLD